jgi:hypothetical protein
VLPLSDVIRDSAVQLVLTHQRGAVGVYFISVNMFGPLLRLPAFFCLSPVLCPSPPGVRASNRSWQLSRALAPA